MSQLVKITGKNTGKDVSITLTDSNGNIYYGGDLGIMTHFEVKAKYSMVDTKSIINNGAVFQESIPHGLTVIMKFSRYNNGLEALEQNYRNNSNNGVMLSYKLQYQVQNRNGVDSFNITDGKPHEFDLGAYTADQDVTQSVTWEFSDSTATS